jgi:hypothetical protein
MMTRLLGFAATMIAGLVLANGASAAVEGCTVCVTVCVDKGAGVRCTKDCSIQICPGSGHISAMPFAPSLMVREGSSCRVKLKSNSFDGKVHGHTCVLGHALR